MFDIKMRRKYSPRRLHLLYYELQHLLKLLYLPSDSKLFQLLNEFQLHQ